MNLSITKFNFNYQMASKRAITPTFSGKNESANDDKKNGFGTVLVTNPAQLSLLHMHDFHGQNIRMEKVYTAIKQFDDEKLSHQNDIFDKNIPIDKLKLCSGDIFLGENEEDLRVVNEFLNISGALANVMGNHECDMEIGKFSEIVKDRKYKLLGASAQTSITA